MKVKELKERLAMFNDDLEVVVAGDDEGNSFRPIPNGWVSIENFDENLDIIYSEDLADYDSEEVFTKVVVG